ncbi:MAG TPA: hypothetical protein VJ201_01785 [Candidatus Babeliales bacterium]|nr:hypothetical protein [Candidatus Babeliales bacterium]
MRFSKYIFLLFLLYLQACFFISSIPTQWSKEKRQRIEELNTIIKIIESMYEIECGHLKRPTPGNTPGNWSTRPTTSEFCGKSLRKEFKYEEVRDELKKLLMEK